MKKQIFTTLFLSSLIASKSFGQWGNGTMNTQIQTTNGYVGIGTAAPSAKLTIWDANNTSDETQMIRLGLNSTYDYRIFRQRIDGVLRFDGNQPNFSSFRFSTSAASYALSILNNGNIGIGLNSPKAKLDVIGNARIGAEGAGDATSDPNTALTIYASNTPNGLKIKTWNNALKVISIDNVNFSTSPFTIYGNGNATFGNHVEIGFPSSTQNISSNVTIGLGVCQNNAGALAAQCIELRNNTSNGINTLLIVDRDDQDAISMNKWVTGGSFIKNFVVKGSGATYIGTKKPFGNHSDAMLSVDGKGLFKSIYVSTSNAVWADYVFENDYKLMSLNDLEVFYKKYKHLPEIPSTKEVENEMIDVAKMESLLLKKIEELTLYIVELKKEIEILKNKN